MDFVICVTNCIVFLNPGMETREADGVKDAIANVVEELRLHEEADYPYNQLLVSCETWLQHPQGLQDLSEKLTQVHTYEADLHENDGLLAMWILMRKIHALELAQARKR